MFEYYDNIHVYCPGVGPDEPLGLRDVSRKNQFLPGTIRPGRFAQKIERDGSRKKTGTIRSRSNLEVESPIFINIFI